MTPEERAAADLCPDLKDAALETMRKAGAAGLTPGERASAIRDAVAEEREPLLDLLASLEWAGQHHETGRPECPACEGTKPLEGEDVAREVGWAARHGHEPHFGGHSPACKLAAAIRGRGKP
jgi:hypothetical protein